MAGPHAGTVTGLWCYPVKSMQGSALDRVMIGPAGVEGDRQWGVVDTETGKVLSAKRWPALLDARAEHTGAGGAVRITLPGGQACESGDPAADEMLSAWLDHPVRLARPPAEHGTPYELTVDPADDTSDTWDFATPPGSFVDLAHVHLLITASLAAIAAAYPDGDWDVRRFRPTALVDIPDAGGFVEDGWVGSRVRLGDATVEVFMPTPRCAMPGRAQAANGLRRDKRILTTLRDSHLNNLGAYASVVTPGSVAVGDPVIAEPST